MHEHELLPWQQRMSDYREQLRQFNECLRWWQQEMRLQRKRRQARTGRQIIQVASEMRVLPDHQAASIEPVVRPRRRTRGGSGQLTPRQLEIASLIARGYTNKQIAETLTIEVGTAANHVEHILTRLGFRNRSQVAVWYTSQQAGDRSEAESHEAMEIS